ncbi:SSU ribosomal protein S16p [Liberibacter crescens BT-1]|uniref:Small ribosomal subunit protein bS16 n=1 Tax=Liberibacter crescens (strain BT-1) TaxID=1215343 RepID=L0EY00_LIBCB|nr:30S ribosomal protein S16 [Liberibacter crescens]AGA65261.1 SSU ribosomal protein S16p [Liberibacter crescens BT-1]AMC13197.1 30S ribosomal protein S16 [Liberibacter crescens]
MAVKIRLACCGSKKRPYYHIVVANARSPRDGAFIERVGSWNPMLPKDNASRVVLNFERIQHWMKQGAQPTDRVLFFLGKAELIKSSPKNNPNKAKPGKKALERLASKQKRDEMVANATQQA